MGRQPCTQGLGRRRFWPRTPASPPESPRQETMGPSDAEARPGQAAAGWAHPTAGGAPGSPWGRRPQRLFVASARSTGPTSVDPRWVGAVGLSWKATSSHLPELSVWPDGPSDWAGSDTLGRAGAAPRRTTVPWPWSVSRASPSRWPKEAALTGVSRASAWWESTDRLQGCEEGWRRMRCPEHQGELGGIKVSSEACPGQEGPRAPALGDCLPATLGGLGGCLGLGSWPPAAHVAPPSEPGAGRTSAPTGRKLLMRAWRPGLSPVQQPGAKDHPCLAQCLLPPGAWLVVHLEVVSVSPGLCSPPSVARPTGRLEAETGSREERLSEW